VFFTEFVSKNDISHEVNSTFRADLFINAVS